MQDDNQATPKVVPFRRYFFAAAVIITMGLSAYIAMRIGIEILHIEDCAGASLGTISLIVSPAITLIGTLSAVLANLLRQE